jgi:hypothetical protein
MEKKVLDQEEIQALRNLQDKQNSLIISLGQIEYQITLFENQKRVLKENIQQLEKENTDLGKILTEKYGNGNIDLETGEIIFE